MKRTDFLNNPFVTIVVSSLIMVGVYKVGIAVFKNLKHHKWKVFDINI